MPLTIRQVGPCFAGEVAGIDLTRPLPAADIAAIHAGMDKYAVLVFHDQDFTDAQQLTFTQSLGPLELAIGTSLRRPEDHRLPTTFADVSNLDRDNKPFARDDRRRLFAIGMPGAYDALDQETKDLIEDLVCEHSQMYSRAKLGFTDFTPEERERFKPVRQRLVRTHPSTGRKSLYLSSHAGTIIGWPEPEAKALLLDLTEAATQREFVYSHKWRVGDLVMWDNRQTMHRARPFPHDEPRDVRRTTLMGDAPTVAQQAA